MDAWVIVLITIFATILSIYLIGFICSLIFSNIFRRKIRNNINAINLLLVEKKDIISSIDKEIKKLNINYDSLLLEGMNKIRNLINLKVSIDDHIDTSKLLEDTSLKLVSFIDKKKIRNNLNEFISSIKEINDSYRQTVSIINYNIVGYNYWINLRPYRFYYYLRKKNLINKFE